jgi:hypothetical protein
VVVIAASILYRNLLGIPGFKAAMAGIAAVAVGMLLRLGIVFARRVKRRLVPAAVMAATFVAVGILQWPLVAVMLAHLGVRRTRQKWAPGRSVLLMDAHPRLDEVMAQRALGQLSPSRSGAPVFAFLFATECRDLSRFGEAATDTPQDRVAILRNRPQ